MLRPKLEVNAVHKTTAFSFENLMVFAYYSGAPRARWRSPIAKEIYPSQKICLSRDRTPPVRPHHRAPMFNLILSSQFGSTGKLIIVRNIPKVKDRANWSRDTFQPMRGRACVYQQTNQNIAPVIKNFQNNGRSQTELKMSLQYSSRFHI